MRVSVIRGESGSFVVFVRVEFEQNRIQSATGLRFKLKRYHEQSLETFWYKSLNILCTLFWQVKYYRKYFISLANHRILFSLNHHHCCRINHSPHKLLTSSNSNLISDISWESDFIGPFTLDIWHHWTIWILVNCWSQCKIIPVHRPINMIITYPITPIYCRQLSYFYKFSNLQNFENKTVSKIKRRSLSPLREYTFHRPPYL